MKYRSATTEENVTLKAVRALLRECLKVYHVVHFVAMLASLCPKRSEYRRILEHACLELRETGKGRSWPPS